MKIESQSILSKTEDYLLSSLDKIRFIEIVEFQRLDLDSSQFRNAKDAGLYLGCLKKNIHPIIYTIELKNKKNRDKLFNCFGEFTSSNLLKTKSKDRVNISRYNTKSSNILYVGSSTTDFKSRIKNHLGVRGNRVYSLHLSKWDNDINYSIVIKAYEVISKRNEPVDRNLVEIIEQHIWDELQPNFGKRSGL